MSLKSTDENHTGSQFKLKITEHVDLLYILIDLTAGNVLSGFIELFRFRLNYFHILYYMWKISSHITRFMPFRWLTHFKPFDHMNL